MIPSPTPNLVADPVALDEATFAWNCVPLEKLPYSSSPALNSLIVLLLPPSIYLTNNVDFICDAHYLSVSDNYYDGVFIQAVLEHVVQPDIVVKEIKRVLKTNGLVYAETPFMQQVHEGAYDFTRYTVLGHRYLFKEFELIEMGGNKGPEVVLTWSINYFFWSIFRSKKLAKIVSILFGIIILPFKYLVSKKSMYDASSGVFFLGKKINNFCLNHRDLVKLYRGQFK